MDTGDKALFFEKPALTLFPFNHLDHAHAYFPFFPAILKVRLSQCIKNKDSTVIPQNVMLASRIPVSPSFISPSRQCLSSYEVRSCYERYLSESAVPSKKMVIAYPLLLKLANFVHPLYNHDIRLIILLVYNWCSEYR